MEKVFWNEEWDYDAYKNEVNSNSPYVQDDWNQTLVTKINYISAKIHMSCLRGPADTIYVNSKTLPILETLAYYHSFSKTLSSRYHVIINDTLEDNILYIVNVKTLAEPINIPETAKCSLIKLNGTDTDLSNVSFISQDKATQEEIDIYVSKLKGIIKIQNYKPAI